MAIAECRLAPPEYTALAAALLEALTAHGAFPAPEKDGKTPVSLRRLSVQGTERRDGTPGLAVFLHLKAAPGEHPRKLSARFSAAVEAAWPGLTAGHPQLQGLTLHIAGAERRGGSRRKPWQMTLHGPEHLRKRIGGRVYQVPPDGFFQVNPVLAASMTARLAEILAARLPVGTLPEGSRVFDLYGGAGLFSLPLAAGGTPMVCVDSDRRSLGCGEASALAEGLDNCAFQHRNLENPGALAALVKQWGQPAALICDPPRRGLAAPLLKSIRADGPGLLVYVSCDGGTFARDAARLSGAYRLASLRGFDLFPQTHHLEVMGVFERG